METPTTSNPHGHGTRLAFATLWLALALLMSVAVWVLLTAFDAHAQTYRGNGGGTDLHLPWREAGVTERQAAAHLLDRLAFGARPGEVERVVEQGLETWVEHQLAADLPERTLEDKLRRLKTLEMSPRQIAETYPNPGLVLIQAVQAGVIDREALQQPTPGETEGGESQRRMNPQRRQVLEWARCMRPSISGDGSRSTR